MVVALPWASRVAGAQTEEDSTRVRFGGFVDVYHAFDVARPSSRDRVFTTQPVRHNEFNINLGFVEAVLTAPRARGRLALQVGTSVQANYAGEPRLGANSGPDLARHVQEAMVGVRIADNTWVDAGIMLSHIGSESWISRDNLTYTRSLIADFSPYYQSGVRLTWQPSATLTAQLNVVNGWQVISETNGDKSIGARLDWTPRPGTTLSLYNLIGNEVPGGEPRELRVFHGVSLKATPTERLTITGTVDLGTQDLGDVRAWWGGAAVIGRYQATGAVALSARLEGYSDEQQVVLTTGVAAPWRGGGGSLGLDVAPAPRVTWRTEFRALATTRRVYPAAGGRGAQNSVVTTSLSLTL